MDITGTAAWSLSSNNYIWISDSTDITSGTLYYNSGQSDTFTVQCDTSGSDGGSGLYRVGFGPGFGQGGNNDTSPYESPEYQINSATTTDLYVKIVNNGGRVEELTNLYAFTV